MKKQIRWHWLIVILSGLLLVAAPLAGGGHQTPSQTANIDSSALFSADDFDGEQPDTNAGPRFVALSGANKLQNAEQPDTLIWVYSVTTGNRSPPSYL